MIKTIKKRNLSQLILVFLTVFFVSCSGSDSDNPGSDSEVVTSVELRMDKEQDLFYIGEAVEFSVLVNGFSIVNSGAEYYVNNEKIEGYTFTPTSEKEYVIKATYKGVESSNRINAYSEEKGEVFQKFALIEDYTGNWCGWCPRVSYAIEKVSEQTDYIVTVAAHLANNDPMENDYSRALASAFNVDGFPTAYVDRKDTWTYPEPQNLTQVTKLTENGVPSGIKLTSNVTDTEMKVNVSVKFGNSVRKNLKLTVFALEDGIVLKQANYTDFYGGVDEINDFVHDHVLRHSFTNVLGDAIASSETVKGTIFEKEFKADIPASIDDKTKLSFVAIVSYADTKASVNARSVKANETNDYQLK
ncbi:Outer membrane protein Omp28 [Tenacibaculum sp. MAR_2009_124]|uniref:Omp28-related outer membrane protein n=1 Tax=Tenacibaculum sp. MAR_2009_124 TaxID=1250059 RepID=UPI0008952B9A|nr:Omp28-related outer membrane protein [Tenacibaculum sp. MAR_2009_124]SEB98365.1 Outer membrane protein Omp28 [Tenacibaculum sp. MAR_2009_124]